MATNALWQVDAPLWERVPSAPSNELTADGGVRMRVMPDPFARARALRVFTVGPWSIPLSETILYRHSDQASATSELGFLRPLTSHTAMTLLSDAVWRQATHRFDLSQYAA